MGVRSTRDNMDQPTSGAWTSCVLSCFLLPSYDQRAFPLPDQPRKSEFSALHLSWCWHVVRGRGLALLLVIHFLLKMNIFRLRSFIIHELLSLMLGWYKFHKVGRKCDTCIEIGSLNYCNSQQLILVIRTSRLAPPAGILRKEFCHFEHFQRNESGAGHSNEVSLVHNTLHRFYSKLMVR